MQNSMKKNLAYIAAHKGISIAVGIVVLVGGYFTISALKSRTTDMQYTLSRVERGNVIVTVTGSGQVSAQSQVDIKAKVSGDVTVVRVGSGSPVKVGDTMVEIDSRDVLTALQSARISYAKLIQPADAVSRLQSENALASALESKRQAVDDLVKAYDDGFNAVTTVFIDTPDIMNGLNDMLNSYAVGKGYLNDYQINSYGPTARTYRDAAATSHSVATAKFTAALALYKNTSRTSATSSIESLISTTYDMMKSVTEAVKDTKTTVEYAKAIQSLNSNDSTGITALASVVTWTNKANTNLTNIANARETINAARASIITTAQSAQEKQESLTKLQNGPDALDLQSELLSLRQKEYAYMDSFIKAPFDGVVAKISVKKGDTISSGASTVTLVSQNMVANISLNEIDAAKIKLGQKANMTFDAVDGLNITGKVTQVDLVGTVSQGVVTYNVEITFDTQDARVRSGMSVNATVITDIRTDVLVVPNVALKSTGVAASADQYVEVFPGATTDTLTTASVPERVMVETGLVSDENTEIFSGLKEGDRIVTRSVAVAAGATKTAAPTIFSAAGAGGRTTGGGATRAFTR